MPDKPARLGVRAKIAIAVGAIVLLVLVAALALPLLLDVNQYRELIQRKAEAAIGRRVTLGHMSLSVFPSAGIQIEQPEVEGLLAARSLTVGVKLMPLITGGGIQLRKVVLERPELTLSRGADGTWSLPGQTGEATVASGDGGAEAASTSFSLSRLQVADGLVHIKAARPGRGGDLSLDLGVNLVGSLSRSAAGDLQSSVEGRLEGEGLLMDLRGSLSSAADATSVNLAIAESSVDVARARALVEALGQAWPLPEGLLVSRSLKASGHLQSELAGGSLARAAVEDFVLQGAELSVRRDRGGVWSFEPLLSGDRAPTGSGPGAAAGPQVTVRNARLEGAAVELNDESLTSSGGAAVKLGLKDLELAVDDLSPGRPMVLKLRARVEPGAGSVSLAGTLPDLAAGVANLKGPIEARVEVKDIDVRAVAPYLTQLLGVPAESGTVSIQGEARGEYPASVRLVGGLALDDVKIAVATRPVTAKADFDLTQLEAAARTQLTRLSATFGSSRVEVRGSIDNRGAGTMVDLEVPPASVAAADIEALLAVAGVRLPVGLTASQPVRLQARVRGDVKSRKDLDLSGSIEVAGATLSHPRLSQPMEQLRGVVAVRNDAFDVSGFSCVIGRSDVAGTLSVADLDAPKATFALTSRRADFWELMSFMKEEPPGPSKAPAAPSGPAGDDYLDKIGARGTLRIGEGSMGKLGFSDLSTTLSLQGKVIRLDPVSMKLYGGSMEGAASMDMGREPAAYSVTARPAGVDVDALLAANLGMKDMLAGRLGGNLSLAASGSGLQEILGAAKGSGSVRIEAGRVGAINVLKVLSRASDLLGEESLKEVSDRLARKGTEFSLLSATLQVSGGKITTNDLRLASPDLDLTDDGALDMLAGTIDIAGQIVFSEAISEAMAKEKSKAADYFWDSGSGRVLVPLTMAGPIGSPTPNIDWGSAGGRLARRKAEEKVRERLEKAGLGEILGGLGGRRRESEEPEPERAAPPTTPAPAAPAQPAAEGLGVTIQEKGFSGNLLLPDLKIKGTLRGTGITEAKLAVKDRKGAVVHEESLMDRVSGYYAANDRMSPASIGFRFKLDGKDVAVAGRELEVVITLRDAEGRTATESIRVKR